MFNFGNMIRYLKKGDDDEAMGYFKNVLPKIRADNYRRRDMVMYEFTQYPGEVIFIPGGWWHAVLNLDDTVAVTENYVNPGNFDHVWRKTRKGRRKVRTVASPCVAILAAKE